MRVSTQQVWQSSLRSISEASVAQSQKRDVISSGNRINRPSDDPAAADRSAQLRASVEAITQYERAGQDAISFMNAQDRTLQTVLDRLTRVEELSIAMATDTLTAEGRAIAAAEVVEIREELLDVVNTKHRDTSLFGGFQDIAVTDTGTGVVFSGDVGQVLRRIDNDQIVQVNIDAQEALGFNAGRSVFDVLDDIVVDAGNADVTALGGARLDELKMVRETVGASLGLVGTRTGRVEATMEDLTVAQAGLQVSVADLEDTDLVEASIELSEANLAYEAALAASAQINRVSLLNYL